MELNIDEDQIKLLKVILAKEIKKTDNVQENDMLQGIIFELTD